MMGQITGHLWHHFAGSWAHMPWLELALSLCLRHTLPLCLRTCTLHPSLFALVTAYVTETVPLCCGARACATTDRHLDGSYGVCALWARYRAESTPPVLCSVPVLFRYHSDSTGIQTMSHVLVFFLNRLFI